VTRPPDYLWDGTGPADPDVARLEAALSPLRYRAPLRNLAPRRPPRRRLAPVVAAAALAAGVALWWGLRSDAPRGVACTERAAPGAFRFEAVSGGPPRCGGAALDRGWMPVGATLETGASAEARIEVADIGRLDVLGGSQLALVATSATEHRVALAHGRVHARVTAPPRLFVIDTPAATAIDLGCEYTLEIETDGRGMLEVTSGIVELIARDAGPGRTPERAVVVPMGARARIIPGRGPGTPVAVRARAPFVALVDRFDAGDDTAFEELLAAATRDDTITLWNLLAAAPAARRGPIVDRLSALVPPPASVQRDDLVLGDPAALEDWRAVLEEQWLYGVMPSFKDY